MLPIDSTFTLCVAHTKELNVFVFFIMLKVCYFAVGD